MKAAIKLLVITLFSFSGICQNENEFTFGKPYQNLEKGSNFERYQARFTKNNEVLLLKIFYKTITIQKFSVDSLNEKTVHTYKIEKSNNTFFEQVVETDNNILVFYTVKIKKKWELRCRKINFEFGTLNPEEKTVIDDIVGLGYSIKKSTDAKSILIHCKLYLGNKNEGFVKYLFRIYDENLTYKTEKTVNIPSKFYIPLINDMILNSKGDIYFAVQYINYGGEERKVITIVYGSLNEQSEFKKIELELEKYAGIPFLIMPKDESYVAMSIQIGRNQISLYTFNEDLNDVSEQQFDFPKNEEGGFMYFCRKIEIDQSNNVTFYTEADKSYTVPLPSGGYSRINIFDHITISKYSSEGLLLWSQKLDRYVRYSGEKECRSITIFSKPDISIYGGFQSFDFEDVVLLVYVKKLENSKRNDKLNKDEMVIEACVLQKEDGSISLKTSLNVASFKTYKIKHISIPDFFILKDNILGVDVGLENEQELLLKFNPMD